MTRKALLVAQGLDGWVRIDIGKGCVLKLRSADYYAAIDAGKAERRALAQSTREAERQAADAAGGLAWIDEDTGGKL